MSSTAGSGASSPRPREASAGALVACIVGPTAAGKSALAMALAEANGLAIVSADSRQVYTGFDVGTAKPTHDERARVPHFGIDVATAVERYSAHRWATEAQRWCEQAVVGSTPPVIVGGTGLYVRALVEPLDPVPALDAEQRAALEPFLATLDRDTLHRWCTRLDPARAALGRTQQLRAVETALLTGTRLSDHLGGERPAGPAARYLVVDPGPILASRIAQRVHAMMANGFVEEVERLRAVVPPDAPAWNASGYGVVRAAVEGTMSMAAAIERVIIETRQYAKRQRTWFRHQLPASAVTLVNPLDVDAVMQAQRWWDRVVEQQRLTAAAGGAGGATPGGGT
jgi:tRNA dimethylallyltransferase